MKRKLLILITAALMLAAVITLTSCSGTDYYGNLDKDGYTVSVTFDPGNGQINSTASTVTDVFNPSDYTPNSSGKIEISLLAPDDIRRDANNRLTLVNPYHFLAGWYTERTPIDENDLSRGYTYSGKWNFDTDSLTLDPNGNYTASESQITLYAAWIPYFDYEIYAEDASGSWKLIGSQKNRSLNIPTWTEDSVTIEMGNFPSRSGYTLDCVYIDEDCLIAAAESDYAVWNADDETYTLTGKWDVSTGTQTEATVKLYTKWTEGEQYRIYTAEDLRKNANVNGHYEIMRDLDFSKVKWHSTFKNGEFNGTINGNGHTISNISIESGQDSKKNGLFGSIGENAVFCDVTFENIVHTIDAGRVSPSTYFGLLAGIISDDASFTDVSVSGSILLGDKCQNLKNYAGDYIIGLLCADGTPSGVTYSEETIICEKEDPDNERLTFAISVDDDGFVTLDFED